MVTVKYNVLTHRFVGLTTHIEDIWVKIRTCINWGVMAALHLESIEKSYSRQGLESYIFTCSDSYMQQSGIIRSYHLLFRACYGVVMLHHSHSFSEPIEFGLVLRGQICQRKQLLTSLKQRQVAK